MGALQSTVTVETSRRYTYSAAIVASAPAAAATDLFTLTGASARLVKVLRWLVTVSATAAAPFDFQLVKRSTANTGGTSTTPTIVPWDTAFPAASAVARLYSANPTVGTLVGVLAALRGVVTPTASGDPAIVPVRFDLVDPQHGPVVLRATTDVLALNLNGQTIGGGLVTSHLVWTEE